jgi:hypothetical protein
MRELLAQLRCDLSGGHSIDASSLDHLAISALLDGKPQTAAVLATIANGQRLAEILAELEPRNG